MLAEQRARAILQQVTQRQTVSVMDLSALGGSIRIESREFMGTTFFMEFPVIV